jgi:hypothetical protein
MLLSLYTAALYLSVDPAQSMLSLCYFFLPTAAGSFNGDLASPPVPLKKPVVNDAILCTTLGVCTIGRLTIVPKTSCPCRQTCWPLRRLPRRRTRLRSE